MRCKSLAQRLQLSTGCRCLSPQIMQRRWVRGKMLEEAHDYLPGYLFLYSDTALTSFPWMDGMIRWLGREELKGNDYEFAAMLYRRNGVIGTAKVAEIGDRVKLADPAWENMDGKIIKLDRHRKRCCIAFLFEKAERTVWVGYDMVAPQESEITG